MEVYVTAIGIAIQTLLYLLGGYAMIVRNDVKRKAQADAVKLDVAGMREELKQLAKVVTAQAVQNTRIDNLYSQMTLMHQTIEALRRGNGWIQRHTVDGEYP